MKMATFLLICGVAAFAGILFNILVNDKQQPVQTSPQTLAQTLDESDVNKTTNITSVPMDDATDHHDGGTPIPVPGDVAERLKGRGVDLTGIPIEGQTDEPS